MSLAPGFGCLPGLHKIIQLYTVFCNVIAQSNNWIITGEVKDQHNVPLPAASVRLKIKGTGILTNQSGKFVLKGNAAAANDTLGSQA